MKSPFDADQHAHAEELLEDYLLGTLSADDRAWMDRHIDTCRQCQEEIGPLLGAIQALPFAAPEPDVAMSGAVWERIEHSISQPTGEASVPTDIHSSQPPMIRTSPSRFTSRQWLMVAALMLVSLIGGVLLAQALPRIGGEPVQSQRIAVQFVNPGNTATGELQYLPEQQVFVFTVQNMPPPPAGHVYQAWLIDSSGPVSAGVINPTTGELASAGNRNQFETFAITVEPGPTGAEAPTTEPIMVAPLHDSGTS